MKAYTLTLLFDNLDNFMGTDYQATARFDIQSDNYSHAYMLAEKFCKVMQADRFDLDEK